MSEELCLEKFPRMDWDTDEMRRENKKFLPSSPKRVETVGLPPIPQSGYNPVIFREELKRDIQVTLGIAGFLLIIYVFIYFIPYQIYWYTYNSLENASPEMLNMATVMTSGNNVFDWYWTFQTAISNNTNYARHILSLRAVSKYYNVFGNMLRSIRETNEKNKDRVRYDKK